MYREKAIFEMDSFSYEQPKIFLNSKQFNKQFYIQIAPINRMFRKKYEKLNLIEPIIL